MRRSIMVCAVLAGLAAAAAAPAQVNPPQNVILLKNLDRGETYSGNWGYTAPNGTELAISGTVSGTSFINATDPANAYEVAFIAGPNSTWREMATLGTYCYIVTEATGAALQVVDLSNPLQPVLVATLNPPAFFYATAHEIKADPQTGFLYVCGTNPGSGQPDRGLVILDTSGSPTSPTLRGSWTTNYVHDISILDGTAYAASIYDGIVYVLDVRNAGTPPILAQWTYPGASTHNTWPSADGNYLVTTDEVTGFTLKMWNIANLPAVAQTDDFASPTGAIVHNAYLRGNLCYVAWYKDGLRVLDVSDPYDIRPVGWYDTHIQNGSGYAGAWGCYSFAQDPTIAYISDMQSGTFILRYSNQLGTLAGTVRDAQTLAPIAGALVEVAETSDTRLTNAQGFYSFPLLPGAYTVDCSVFGYASGSAGASVATGVTTTLDFDLAPLAAGALTGVVRDANQSPLAAASVVIEGTPLATATDASGIYNFPTIPAGSYDATASKFGFAAQTLPVTITAAQQATRDFALLPAFFASDMEASPGAWTVSGNATAGQWVRVDPVGTFTGGAPVQPEDDHTPAPGVLCWVTGNGLPGGAIGDADVDNGSTVLTTQTFDLTALADPVLDYWRWFSNDANGSADDPWVVEVSGTGGTSWTAIENTLVAQASWRHVTVRLGDVLTLPIAQFRVRFTARDISPGSIVEAAVDDFQIYDDGATTGLAGDPDPAAGAGRPALHGNFPNPFNPQTAIRFELAQEAPVRIRIFDAAGRTVRVLAADRRFGPGAQSVIWDGRNDGAAAVASGVYYYRVEAPGFSAARSMVLAK